MGEERVRTIRLSDEYVIRQDNLCCWIEQRRKTDKGKEYYTRVSGYCTSYEHLLNNFASYKARNVEANNIKDAIKQMREIESEIKQYIKEMLKGVKG